MYISIHKGKESWKIYETTDDPEKILMETEFNLCSPWQPNDVDAQQSSIFSDLCVYNLNSLNV
jgi:hypothetical protein